ncbi:hypothetical protein [Streptomyces sp. HB2AG]|uniref:hypothetical protein n=1 Tax=Streptomyces sp. HB2AG TaxID=2983400 RepID=UPI0022AAE5FC|nr:hypothetical protein [Streptomyces sp. HB2AG]MCZ2524087.1 hypothetical protein [Streptomyces sp. HB2AG]
MDPSEIPADRDRPGGPRPPSAPGRAEDERLRETEDRNRRRLRWTFASVLLALAFLLSPVAVVAAWMDSQISDVDRYVETVAPLATDPAVQDAVSDRLTDRVVDNVDLDAFTAALAKALERADAPPRVVDNVPALAGPLKNALAAAVDNVVTKVVTGDRFPQFWENANRRAHAAVVKTLTGEGTSAVQARGDTVVLDLGTVVDEVQRRLVDAGYERAANIPDVDRTIPLLQTDKLSQAQTAMQLINVLGPWLPPVTIALAALAVWTAPRHRAALLAAAIGIGVMMLLLLAGLAVMRQVYVNSVPPTTLPRDAATAVYDTLVRFLRQSTLTILVVAVLTALTAYLYGPDRAARALRSAAARGTGALGRAAARSGLRTDGAGRWLEAHRGWTTGAVIALGALALILRNYPTPAFVALVLGLVLLALVVLGVLAAAADGPGPSRTGLATGTGAARPAPGAPPDRDTGSDRDTGPGG